MAKARPTGTNKAGKMAVSRAKVADIWRQNTKQHEHDARRLREQEEYIDAEGGELGNPVKSILER